ncbi:MAG TPA: amidohydrolase family protein [Opitutaceae bacterium]|nr:amidohydrolase family protein [Opitutaceae bacterium]
MIIDAHVHMVGNGASGSGCWYRPRGARRLLAPLFIRNMGLTSADVKGDLDRIYVTRLLEHLQGSSLDAVALFAQDDVYREDGTRWEERGTFGVPNDVVLRLARAHSRLLPVVSIHPARPDALEELARCVAEGAVALKLLPNCHNVDCALPRYRKFWEAMAAHDLPFIAHTGGENTLDEVRRELADPRRLREPLERGVTVIAAHCGTAAAFIDRDYFPVFADLLARHPNLFGDTAAFNLPNRCRRLRACLRPGIVGRLVHGSDLPVPVFAHPGLLMGLLGVRAWWRLRRIRNPLERDYQLKRAMGFPDEVFTRAGYVLRLPPPGAEIRKWASRMPFG